MTNESVLLASPTRGLEMPNNDRDTGCREKGQSKRYRNISKIYAKYSMTPNPTQHT